VGPALYAGFQRPALPCRAPEVQLPERLEQEVLELEQIAAARDAELAELKALVRPGEATAPCLLQGLGPDALADLHAKFRRATEPGPRQLVPAASPGPEEPQPSWLLPSVGSWLQRPHAAAAAATKVPLVPSSPPSSSSTSTRTWSLVPSVGTWLGPAALIREHEAAPCQGPEPRLLVRRKSSLKRMSNEELIVAFRGEIARKDAEIRELRARLGLRG